MKNQSERIVEFLDGIIDPSLPPEQQVMLFSQEDVEGAGVDATENGNCINKAATCEGSSNDECTNYNNTCRESTNHFTCTSTNDATCHTLDPSIGSCGGEGGDS